MGESRINSYSNTSKNLNSFDASVAPVSIKRGGLDVRSNEYVRLITSSQTVSDANSTKTVIDSTAHSAVVGDVVRFTSGALSGNEYIVTATTTNTFTINEFASVAPSSGDAFSIFRHTKPLVDSSGVVQVGISSAEVASTFSTAQKAVTNVATILVSPNTARKMLVIYNDNTAALYIGPGNTVSTSTGFVIPAKSTLFMDSVIITSAFYGIYAVDPSGTYVYVMEA